MMAQDFEVRDAGQVAHGALLATQHFNQAVLDTVADGIITIAIDGRIRSFNRASEKIFGYVADEVIGKNIKMLMPQSYAAKHDGHLAAYAASGESKVINERPELEGKTKAGDIIPIEVSVTEVAYDGEAMFVGVVRDIADRKRVDRMKGEFISTVSHELRTPLTSITGSLALIRSGKVGEMSEKMAHLTDIALRNCHRLSALVNDLLDIEKLASGKMDYKLDFWSVRNLVLNAIEDNTGFGDVYGIGLRAVIEGGDLEIHVDRQRFLQVLGNFISNAIKFSPEGGTVEVHVRYTNDRARILVIDRGCGIPREKHDRLFKRFSQVDSSDERKLGGTGLGLAITRDLTMQMGGNTGFESEPGEGSTFWVDFPLVSRRELASGAEG